MTFHAAPSFPGPHGPNSTEAELVSAARLRSESAVRELVRRLNPRLFRVARGIAPSDAEAEEIVQEAYLTAFTRLDLFRGEARFSTWITRIAINAALMRTRRPRPTEEYDTVTEAPEHQILAFPGTRPELPDTALGRAQIRALLEAAVTELPPDLRLAFLLHEAEGMSIQTIAEDLSVNPLTVKTRLFRARRRLRLALEQRIQGGFEAIFPFDGQRCTGMADRVCDGLRALGKL